MKVSVVIPTYNRVEQLSICLAALEAQTYPRQAIEVIVVDDGSTDTTLELLSEKRLLNAQVIMQQHQGQVIALNKGASCACGEVLVFLDDDVVVPPRFISDIMDVHALHERAIVVPVVHSACDDPGNHFAQIIIRDQMRPTSGDRPRMTAFTDLVGCCFTVKRSHFFAIGGMQTLPEKLWPDWNDVDFAYRAMKAGFDSWICPSLTVHHFESAVSSLDIACTRSFNAGYSATRLFRRHPDLANHLPMFRDKGPIVWRQNPPRLILRKLVRQVAWSRPATWLMETSVPILERRAPESKALALFYRWIISGYIFRGYRAGLRSNQQGANP